MRPRHRHVLAILLAAVMLLAGACGINADDRPHPIAPKETTTTVP